MDIKQKIFGDFDFRILRSSEFKEDSVREEIVMPLLKNLGYSGNTIQRSINLTNPFVKIGTTKKPITQIPDYLLKVEDTFAWVLDAKSPGENIKTGENVEQVYSYAIHPEIRTKFFALCNGKKFSLFRYDEQKPLLYFDLPEINNHWDKLEAFLSPDSFQIGKTISYLQLREDRPSYQKSKFEYLNRPLLDEIPVQKQSAKRHFGVHGYFTKQAWNVVHDYIKNFSQQGDLVIDPFGGSGVTAIEALMTDRKAIHIDLNPMSVFMVNSLLAPVKIGNLTEAFNRVKESFLKGCPTSLREIKDALKRYPYPKGFVLPKASDVEKIEDLFSNKQLSQLAFLKHLILKEKSENIRNSLLLAFSSTLTKINLTYHNSGSRDENAGNAAPFAYYRYRIAPRNVDLELLPSFEGKFKKLISAKKDIESKINETTIKNAQIVKGTATDLSWIKKESVDYIYTDPPYGKKIPYLDLSIMWNSWLNLKVTEEDYKLEAIEGGEHHKSKDEYSDLISQSIQEMYRVLKFDRWMSFVFAHKDPALWHMIVDTAEKIGFEYAGAVKQSNGQASFKKRQHPFTVLQGQLIINFKKVRKPRAILKANLGMKVSEIIIQTIEGIIAKHHGATLEQINDELIIKGLELGFLDLLKKEYSDLTPLLTETFDYEEQTQKFYIKEDQKFRTHVDVRLRIHYYILSLLRRTELTKQYLTFDDIVLHIMPLLRNGTTPEKQTILSVLENIGERTGTDKWKLRTKGQTTLFD